MGKARPSPALPLLSAGPPRTFSDLAKVFRGRAVRSVLPDQIAGGRGESGAALALALDLRAMNRRGAFRRAMNRRRADLWPGRHHPLALPALATMIKRAPMRVHDGGGGRRGLRRTVSLTQRDELQGRVHGPAHQLAKRAFVRAAFGHRREHVFARLRIRSDGKKPNVRGGHPGNCGFGSLEPNRGSRAATEIAAGDFQASPSFSLTSNGLPPSASASSSSSRSAAPAIS